MPNGNEVMVQCKAFLRYVQDRKPLVHCITHPITMNDSANAILAVGAVPNMASHPDEVAEVVASADSLAVNLGNITDERMEAMERAGQKACELGIPVLIDVVGIGCSSLRRDFARQFIRRYHPAIIKGNGSEIRSLCGLVSHAAGVNAGLVDMATAETFRALADPVAAYAAEENSVLMMTGPVDIISDGTQTCGVANGTPLLAKLTGTGCMLGALTAVYAAARKPWEAAVLAAVMMGIAGEKAAEPYQGMGSFHVALFDALSLLTYDDLRRNMNVLVAE